MRPAAADLSVPFVARLASFGDRVALVAPAAAARAPTRTDSAPTRRVTYVELAERVAARAAALSGVTGPAQAPSRPERAPSRPERAPTEPERAPSQRGRRLVLLTGANDVETVVTYLAALSAGHPVILVPGDNAGNLAALEAAYDPDVVVAGGELVQRREGSAHELHPDLALLLSTSGSTGSPKLVRLSRRNVEANAASIAEYLSIRPSDVAATTLPMHYCYGLSVINSHLFAGASLLLTSLSVVDTCFWDLVREHGATTFAGVPYTFDLLDRVGFAEMELPSLRYVTQAGGRLAPDRVRQYAELGQRRGWDLYVMYGQTEATARMAYLPPDLAHAAPSAIGVPVPGGSFRLEPLPELPLEGTSDVGELVYSGDNVMLGYAETPADLARGRVVDELRTGDVARRTPDGLYEIIGRRNRFAKIFGLRVDLDQTEKVFAAEGVVAYCAEGGDRLVVAVSSEAKPVDVAAVERIAHEHFGLPGGAVHVCPLPEVPRLPTGKPDYRAITSLAEHTTPDAATDAPTETVGSDRLVALYAEVLRRPDATENDSFVSLDGDSLSYVEMSIRLEEAIGHLPAGWHVTPIRELVGTDTKRRRGLRTLETNVLMRALAIVMIVGSHANLFMLMGGAHLLLGLAGFNFGRFQLTGSSRGERVRHLLTSVGRVAVPSMLWIGGVTAVAATYTWENVLLLNGVLGPRSWAEPEWHYWFIEALVYTLLGLTLLLALPVVDRAERRWPFWLPMMLAGLGLLTRYDVVTIMGGDDIHRANVVFWLFALGWASVKASTGRQRLLVSVMVVGTVPGFFGFAVVREATVVVGMLLLVWVTSVSVPAVVARWSGVLASASLYIYLCHWQIYPHLEDRVPFLATVLSLLGGIVLWQLATRAAPAVLRTVRDRPVACDGATVPAATGRRRPRTGGLPPRRSTSAPGSTG